MLIYMPSYIFLGNLLIFFLGTCMPTLAVCTHQSFSNTKSQTDTLKLLIEKGAKVDFEYAFFMAITSLDSLKGLNLVIETLKKIMTDEQLKAHINKLLYSGGSCDICFLLKKMIEDGTYTEEKPNIHVAAQGGHLDTVTNLLLEEGTIKDDEGPRGSTSE